MLLLGGLIVLSKVRRLLHSSTPCSESVDVAPAQDFIGALANATR
jgi:hypothetical protein